MRSDQDYAKTHQRNLSDTLSNNEEIILLLTPVAGEGLPWGGIGVDAGK